MFALEDIGVFLQIHQGIKKAAIRYRRFFIIRS